MNLLKLYARDRLGLFFGVVFVAFYVVALFAPWIVPTDPLEMSLGEGLLPPSITHWFGTDQFGRDTLSRVILATRVTLQITTSALLFALLLGVPLGMAVGYGGGLADAIVMRLTDMMLIFPTIMIAIVIVVVVGPSEKGVVIALGLSQLPNLSESRAAPPWQYARSLMSKRRLQRARAGTIFCCAMFCTISRRQ